MFNFIKCALFVLYFFSSLLAASTNKVLGGCDIVYGPYHTKLYKGGMLYFKKTADVNNPLALMLEADLFVDEGPLEVDRYEVAGGPPSVESIFFYPVGGKDNVLVIVSWEINSRGIGTYGKLYQVYAYEKNINGKLISNRKISNNNDMSGMDGYQEGSEIRFLYRTSSDVKNYIKKLNARALLD